MGKTTFFLYQSFPFKISECGSKQGQTLRRRRDNWDLATVMFVTETSCYVTVHHVLRSFYHVLVFCLSQEGKKKFDKETEKYYTVLEKHLALSSRKKEPFLQEVSPSYETKQEVSPSYKTSSS